MLSRFALLASAAFVLSSAALAEEDEQQAKSETDESAVEEKVCFNRRQVRSFDGLSDEHVFIEQSGKEYFLLTMRNRCTGLRDAHGIGIKDTMSRICSNGFGEIVYRDFSRRLATCRIGTVERVENKDEAKALIAEREEYEKHKKDKDKDAEEE